MGDKLSVAGGTNSSGSLRWFESYNFMRPR